MLRRPLQKAEYMDEKRSNIPNDTEWGRGQREKVYDEFLKYQKWKRESRRYDLGDVVLELIQLLDRLQGEIFASAYLDEVSKIARPLSRC